MAISFSTIAEPQGDVTVWKSCVVSEGQRAVLGVLCRMTPSLAEIQGLPGSDKQVLRCVHNLLDT